MDAATRPSARAAVELLLVVAIIVGDYYGWVPVTSTPFLLVLGWISLRMRGLRWRDTGFCMPPRFVRTVVLGIAIGVAMELFATFVTVPLLASITGAPPDLSEFSHVVGNLRLLLVWLAVSWILAAFGEELAFRGYVLPRFADAAGRSRGGWVLALALTSVLFGWGHGGQGLAGMLQESFAGLLLGVLYLASGRNLALPIVAHGVSNTVAFVLIYLDRYPGV